MPALPGEAAGRIKILENRWYILRHALTSAMSQGLHLGLRGRVIFFQI